MYLKTQMGENLSHKDLNLQKLKGKLLIANQSASKASIYYTPPEDELRRSYTNLQISPIHINYINENLEDTKRDINNFIKQQNVKGMLLNSPQRNADNDYYYGNETDGGAANMNINNLKTYDKHAAVTDDGGIETNFPMLQHYGGEIKKHKNKKYNKVSLNEPDDHMQTEGKNILELSHLSAARGAAIGDYKDDNDVKNSKSCPAIYKMSKQKDGSTLHEILTDETTHLNPVNFGNSQTPKSKKKHCKDKLNIILDENGKSTLYDMSQMDSCSNSSSSNPSTASTNNLTPPIFTQNLNGSSNAPNKYTGAKKKDKNLYASSSIVSGDQNNAKSNIKLSYDKLAIADNTLLHNSVSLPDAMISESNDSNMLTSAVSVMTSDSNNTFGETGEDAVENNRECKSN